ncbi:MAG: molybdopterin-dependent oxidoreductase [Betaproteobacteria bacterium]|nr:molybdopterin-dependent oxidoreductase [Betaproteobacteria bacterium]
MRHARAHTARHQESGGGGAMNAPRKLPGNLETNRALERWLRINADGTVTAYTGKVEIGQGILTAIEQVVADELDVSPQRVGGGETWRVAGESHGH